MSRHIRSALAVVAIAVAAAVGSYLVSAHATGLSGVQWTQIGPAPLQINAEQNFQGAGPDSGQVVDIAIDPRGSSDQTIYIATGSGGIWKSEDAGTTWTPKTENLLTLSMGAVALDPGNPSIVYAGTDNPAFGGDCPGCNFQAVGIYKSLDGGNTWTLLPNSPAGVAIRRIVFPAPGTLLVATTSGLYRSTDAGGTFSKLLGSAIDDIRLDAQSPSTTVRVSITGQGIFVSSNIGAATPTFTNLWTNSNGSPRQNTVRPGSIGFIAFAQSTTVGGQTIYTTVGNASPPTGASNFLGMWVSTDGGSTWSNLTGANNAGDADGNNGSGCQCGYDQTIGVDPTNDKTVYIGFQEVWKSTDGGASFSGSGITLNQVHWDHHAFLFGPHDATGQTFYVGQDGGIATTSNGGGNFTNINGSTSFANGAIASNLLRMIDIGRGSSTNRQYTYGGFQDTGNAQFAPGYTGNTWQLGQDGDGGPMTVDPCDPTHALSTDDGGYSQTTTAGSAGSWSGSVTLSPAVPSGFNLSANAYAFDQTCDKTVYAAFNISDPKGVVATTFGLYQSTDNGNNYALVDSVTTGLTAVATVHIDPNVVWIGLNNGSLAFSTNALLGATSTWTALPDPSGTGQAVLGIAIDPINTDTVFVVYPGISNASPSKHIFMTSDRGAHWTDVSGIGTDGLPDLPLHAVAIDPSTGTTPRTVIVGGDGGVFQTTNDGATWQVLGLGLPTVGVTAVALDSSVSPSLLRIGTYGRSSFELGAATGPLLAINTNLNFGTVCPGQSPTTLLQLFNVGAADLTINNIQRVSGSPDFTINGPTFPVTIKPGEEVDWTITLKVTSSSTNPEGAVFQIDSNDSFNAHQQVTYTATVGAPIIGTVIANGGNFGNVCAGSFADLNLTATNSGSCDLDITGLMFAPPLADFQPASASFPIAVHAGGSLAIPIRFKPVSSTAGPETTSITVLSNAPGVAPTVSVTGNAPPGKIAVSGSGTFGNVCAGSGAQQVITIGNTGPCNLNVTAVTLSLNANGTGVCPDFTIANNPFPAALSADSSLPVTIAFTPSSGGAKTCYLQITSDDPTTPHVTLPLTATTPAVNLNVPATESFPPTVIQSVGACGSKLPYVVSNDGSCPVLVDKVQSTGDYSLLGLPSLPTAVSPNNGQLGAGDLGAVFKPITIERADQGTIAVTYETDPITHTTAIATTNVCGEGVTRGLRLLVTAGGVPLASVDKIQLHRLESNRKSISIDNVNNAPLQTVTQAAPCSSFQFQREWGGVSNPIQLTAGDYQITVNATVNNRKVSQTISFSLGTCAFDQNIVVAF